MGLAKLRLTSYKERESERSNAEARGRETMAEFDDMTYERQHTFVNFIKVSGWSCAIIAVTLLLMAFFLL